MPQKAPGRHQNAEGSPRKPQKVAEGFRRIQKAPGSPRRQQEGARRFQETPKSPSLGLSLASLGSSGASWALLSPPAAFGALLGSLWAS